MAVKYSFKALKRIKQDFGKCLRIADSTWQRLGDLEIAQPVRGTRTGANVQ